MRHSHTKRWSRVKNHKNPAQHPGFHHLMILLAISKSGEIYHKNRLFFFSSGEYLSLFVLEKDGTSLRKSNSPTISKCGCTICDIISNGVQRTTKIDSDEN